MDSPSSMWDKRPNDFSNEGPSYYQSQWRKEGKDWNTGQNGDNIPFDPKGSGSLLANPNASRNARHMPRQSESDDIEGEEHGKLGYRQNMNRQSRAYRPTQTIRPYAIVPQPGRQTGRPQQAAAAPRIPVAGNNAPVGGDAPAQGQGGAFPAVMAAASAAVATFSGAISAAAANVTLFSTALTAAMANMGPKTAFSGAPNNADNPFS